MKKGKGSLAIHLVDVDGNRLRDTGKLTLEHRTFSEREELRGDLSKRFRFFGLREAPQGTYVLTVKAKSYQTARRFVMVRGNELIELPMFVKPRKVRPVFDDLDPRLARLIGRSGVKWEKLSAERKAGLCNIAAKSFVAPIAKKDLLGQLLVLEVFEDRVWVALPAVVFTRVSKAWDFVEVSGALHEPPAGYEAWGSYKTRDAVGNLQLSFFRRMPEANCYDRRTGESQYVADVDIDNASGLAHALDVVKHTITGKGTHPYDIHEILVHWQGLDPGYRLEPKA